MTIQRQFTVCWGASIVLFIGLFFISTQLNLYKQLPVYGFIGYGLVILNILWALSLAQKAWHFIAVSFSLILFGTIGSFDIVMSKQEMLNTLMQLGGYWFMPANLSAETLDDYVNVLIILLNIFTSALAGNTLFYGVNRHNFQMDCWQKYICQR